MPGSGPVKCYNVDLPLDGCVQRANAGYLAPGQTKVFVCVDAISTTGATTVPLPTPPAGKQWIITDAVLLHDQNSAQAMKIQVGGITVYSVLSHGSAAPDILNSMETQVSCAGGLAPQLVITGTASMHTTANIYGIQQARGTG